MGDFLAVRSEVCVVAELAGSLARAAACRNAARGADLVGEVIKDSARAGSRGDAAASEEDVFVVCGVRGAAARISFGDGVS